MRVLPLGTDNFGRDVLTELVMAIRVSLLIGIVAGTIATAIGLTLGLLAGYVGGRVDDVIMFFTNLFTVIPTFILLILISFSMGQDKRGPVTVAVAIGFTSWIWTARAVRAQVFSLRNRDHVNLSKLSGHSIVHIILTDILPYIDQVDQILLMSVEPGFSGQPFGPESVVRLKTLKTILGERPVDIQVDGGINRLNYRDVIDAGANYLVIGTAFYKDADPEAWVREMHSLIS